MRLWLAPSAFFPHRGGVEELTLKLAQHLHARDHDVTVVTHRWPADLPSVDEVDGVPTRRVAFDAPRLNPSATLHFVAQVPALLRELDSLPRPDLVHVQGLAQHVPLLALWARRRSVPLVLTSQGEVVMDADQVFQCSRYLRASTALATRRAAAFTACSAWTRDRAAEMFGPFREARVIPNAIDPADWSNVPPTPTEPVVAAWGRHVTQKGFAELLAAFPRVRSAIPDAQLLIGGDGPEHAALRAAASEGVTFLGSLDRAGVRDLLGRARVVAVPSLIEPFGIVALEAIAAGRPVVWSRNGGLGEAVGATGYPVDPRDPGDLADGIVRALQADVDTEALDARAHEFTWDAITDQYEQVYRDVQRAQR